MCMNSKQFSNQCWSHVCVPTVALKSNNALTLISFRKKLPDQCFKTSLTKVLCR